MTANKLRGQSVLGTNSGSFKAKTNSAPGAGATLSTPATAPTKHSAYDDLAEETMFAEEHAARGGSLADAARSVRDANLVQLAGR